jgi:hypothetical protein
MAEAHTGKSQKNKRGGMFATSLVYLHVVF